MKQKEIDLSIDARQDRKGFTLILLGFFIMLMGSLGLTNASRISGFFNYIVTFLFGKLNIIIFILLILLGFYVIFKPRIKVRIRFTYGYAGIALLFLTVFAMGTYFILKSESVDVGLLEIKDFFAYWPPIKEIPATYVREVGGGFIGYLLLIVFTKILGPGTNIIMVIVLFSVGLAMIMEPLWRYLSTVVSYKLVIRKKEKEYYDSVTEFRPAADSSAKDSTAGPSPLSKNIIPLPLRTSDNIGGLKPLEYKKSGKPVSQESSSGTEEVRLQEKKIDIYNVPPAAPRKERANIDTLSLKKFNFEDTAGPIGEVRIEELIANPQKTIKETITMPAMVKEEAGVFMEEPDEKDYEYPSLDLLADLDKNIADEETNDQVAKERIEVLNQLFDDFDVKATAVSYTVGPSITSFDIQLDRSTTLNSVTAVIKEISLRLRGLNIIFNESVPGKTNPTLEVPNKIPMTVSFKEMLRSINEDKDSKNKIIIPFGKNVFGKIVSLPLDKVIHMLIAGTTGSGKSVFMHTVILSLIMRCHPDELKLLIIDPKRVEMNKYFDIPHLLAPIINRYDEAKNALDLILKEVNSRYDVFDSYRIDKIETFNKKARALGLRPYPRIVVVIDEYADLVDGSVDGVNYGAAISNTVEKIAAISRASGVHLVIATQRPTTKVVTGNLKGNILTKVGLLMSSYVDSTTIIGHAGADQLAGNGDMLVKTPELSKKDEVRVQGAFVTGEDIRAVVDYLNENHKPAYDERFMNLKEEVVVGSPYSGSEETDPEYEEIKAHALTIPYISTNYILRTFGGGFNKAKRIISQLQYEGIVALNPDSPQSNKGLRVLAYKGPINEGEGI